MRAFRGVNATASTVHNPASRSLAKSPAVTPLPYKRTSGIMARRFANAHLELGERLCADAARFLDSRSGSNCGGNCGGGRSHFGILLLLPRHVLVWEERQRRAEKWALFRSFVACVLCPQNNVFRCLTVEFRSALLPCTRGLAAALEGPLSMVSRFSHLAACPRTTRRVIGHPSWLPLKRRARPSRFTPTWNRKSFPL